MKTLKEYFEEGYVRYYFTEEQKEELQRMLDAWKISAKASTDARLKEKASLSEKIIIDAEAGQK